MYNLEKDKDKYYILGKLIKIYGYRGEMVMHIDNDQPVEYADLKMFFINMEQSLVPWFIEHINIQHDRAQLKIEDIDSPEDARRFIGKEVYLPLGKHKRTSGQAHHYMEFIGFKAIDKNHGAIGIVEDILDRPEQKLIRIMKDEKEILVPLSEDMIIGVDKQARELHLNTPAGLIELYLQ